MAGKPSAEHASPDKSKSKAAVGHVAIDISPQPEPSKPKFYTTYFGDQSKLACDCYVRSPVTQEWQIDWWVQAEKPE
jgi:hypothetical protein